MSLVRIEPIIASAAVTTRRTTWEPSRSSGGKNNDTAGARLRQSSRREKHHLEEMWQTLAFEGRICGCCLCLLKPVKNNEEFRAVITVCLLLRATGWGLRSGQAFRLPPDSWPCFSCPSFLLAAFPQEHASFVWSQRTTSRSCLFVPSLKQLEATDSHEAPRGPSWHHVCLPRNPPEVYFLPARLADSSSVYPICRGVSIIYENAIDSRSSSRFGTSSLYV